MTIDVWIARKTPVAGFPERGDGMTEWEVRIDGRLVEGRCAKRADARLEVLRVIEQALS